jgi:hypothetical protein
MGHLFQIHVRPKYYEPGSQIFTLRQNLKNEGKSCNLAFEGGSDQTIITERYAREMGFRKLDMKAAVASFAET